MALNKFNYSCIIDDLKTIKNVYQHNKIDIHNNNDEAFKICCTKGSLKVAKWLYKIGGPINYDIPFELALINKHFDIAGWIYDIRHEDEEIIVRHNKVLINIIMETGDLFTCQWLNSLENFDIDTQNFAFIVSCEYGYISIAEWLFSLGNISIYSKNEAFIQCCFYGYFNIAKWIYSLNDIDINYNNSYAFRMSCYRNFNTITQWLYSLGPINIYANKNEAFKYLCINGNINMAKIIYGLGKINIHMDNNIIFKLCDKYHEPIKKWLHKIKKKHLNP